MQGRPATSVRWPRRLRSANKPAHVYVYMSMCKAPRLRRPCGCLGARRFPSSSAAIGHAAGGRGRWHCRRDGSRGIVAGAATEAAAGAKRLRHLAMVARWCSGPACRALVACRCASPHGFATVDNTGIARFTNDDGGNFGIDHLIAAPTIAATPASSASPKTSTGSSFHFI